MLRVLSTGSWKSFDWISAVIALSSEPIEIDLERDSRDGRLSPEDHLWILDSGARMIFGLRQSSGETIGSPSNAAS